VSIATAAEGVLQFWFEQTPEAQWWQGDPAFDARVGERFAPLLGQAAAGELHAWRDSARGRLAEVIVLDQFPRNIHRGTAQAFAHDPMALVLSQEAVRAGALAELPPVQRAFLLLPMMHSESAAIHAVAEPLYREHAPASNYQFELRHKAIIDRFGRYPHRNALLGRESTAAELDFLQQPGSGF
jgi:uncharacterized protein (DUF924 family)